MSQHHCHFLRCAPTRSQLSLMRRTEGTRRHVPAVLPRRPAEQASGCCAAQGCNSGANPSPVRGTLHAMFCCSKHGYIPFLPSFNSFLLQSMTLMLASRTCLYTRALPHVTLCPEKGKAQSADGTAAAFLALLLLSSLLLLLLLLQHHHACCHFFSVMLPLLQHA